MLTSGTDVGPANLPTSGTQCTAGAAHAFVLHEGYYRLGVLTDGAPLRFTLTLRGLGRGTTTLSPTHRLASLEKDLPASDSAGSTLVTFGTTAHVPGASPAFVALKATGTTDPTFSGAGTCTRQDELPPPPFAYGPPCPNGTSGSWMYTLKAPDGTRYGGVGVFTAPSSDNTADIGIGGSVADSGGVTFEHALGVWAEPVPMPS